MAAVRADQLARRSSSVALGSAAHSASTTPRATLPTNSDHRLAGDPIQLDLARACCSSPPDRLDRLADPVGVLIEQHLRDDLLDRQTVGTRHAALLSSSPETPDDLQRRVGRNHVPSDPDDTTLRDVTPAGAAAACAAGSEGTARDVAGERVQESA
jgi:hypothetical protein